MNSSCRALSVPLLVAFLLCLFVVTAYGNGETLDSMPSLVSDHKAYKAGQNVTVLIYEQAASTTSADTRTSKSTDVSGRIEGTNQLEIGSGVALSGSLGLGSSAKGEGSISRQGSLVASVSATVVSVLPSGEMMIKGEQKIEFNDETQHIKIAGRIRPEDITVDNTILSSRIAQADITYVGDGLLGSRQKPGIITRFFNWLF